MPRRVALAPISGNRKRGGQLSIEYKHELYGQARAGASADEIAKRESLTKSNVTTILTKATHRSTLEAAVRSGRPKEHSDRDERTILHVARRMPLITYAALKRKSGLNFSTSTYKHILRAHHIYNWMAKKRPHLTERHNVRHGVAAHQLLVHNIAELITQHPRI